MNSKHIVLLLSLFLILISFMRPLYYYHNYEIVEATVVSLAEVPVPESRRQTQMVPLYEYEYKNKTYSSPFGRAVITDKQKSNIIGSHKLMRVNKNKPEKIRNKNFIDFADFMFLAVGLIFLTVFFKM